MLNDRVLLCDGTMGSRVQAHDLDVEKDYLGAGALGIEMAEEDQLHPEQSTSAIAVLLPQARYFTV